MKTVSKKRRVKMKEIKCILEGFYVTRDDDLLIRDAAKKSYQTKSGFLRQLTLERVKEIVERRE